MRRRSELELFEALRSREHPADLAELADRLRRCVHWVLNRMDGGHRLSGEIEDIVGDARLRLERLRERGFAGSAPEFKSYLYYAYLKVGAIDKALALQTELLRQP